MILFVQNVDYAWEIQERFFLLFADCNKQQGTDNANHILKTVSNHDLAIRRGQAFDKGSYMAGKYNGCQAHIWKKNPTAFFISCATHS